ncbi:hypothetical protein LTR42_011672 [Elasticomyces elasticus]|nr:hypothetical protein LTR42_011672 [Elasticomyces elasticus]
MHNLPEGVQADILEIATRFREIDMFVLCEFRDGHGVVPNPHTNLGDQTGMDLLKYRDSDVSDFSTLCKTHDEDDILPYLRDQRLKEFWLVVFDSLCTIWARNSFYFLDNARARFYEVQDLMRDLHELLERPLGCSDVPNYVKVGISERLSVIDSFVDTCEGILGRYDAGSRAMYDAYETKPPRRPWYDPRDHNNGCDVPHHGRLLQHHAVYTFRFLQRRTSRWMRWCMSLGITMAVLTPTLYYVAGPALGDFFASTSGICSALITLYLVQGLRKAGNEKQPMQ